jgi:hypothetical protein
MTFESKLIKCERNGLKLDFEVRFEEIFQDVKFTFVGSLPLDFRLKTMPRGWRSALGDAKLMSLNARLHQWLAEN